MKFLWCLPLSVLFLCCSGCMSVSLKPYYTPENQIPVPDELVGLWRLEKLQGKTQKTNLLQLQIAKNGETKVTQFPEKEGEETIHRSTFYTQCFRVNGELYADCMIRSLKTLPAAEALTMVPGHLLVKLSVSGETFRAIYPLNLPGLAEDGKLPPGLTRILPETTPGKAEAIWVFTAPGSVWEETLKTMSPQIFPDDSKASCEFRRVLIQ